MTLALPLKQQLKKMFNRTQLQNILQGLKQKINDPLGKKRNIGN